MHGPRAHRALQGWGKMAPAHSRLPLPWLGLMALLGAMLWRNQWMAALCALLMFVLYLRPGEALTMTPEQMVPPLAVAAGAAHLAAWGFIIGPSLLGGPSKTGV